MIQINTVVPLKFSLKYNNLTTYTASMLSVCLQRIIFSKLVTWMHSFPFCGLIYQNLSNSQELWNNTRRYEILHSLNLGCSFITLREPCNNQRSICAIAWLYVTNHLHHGFPRSTVKQSNAVRVDNQVGVDIEIMWPFCSTSPLPLDLFYVYTFFTM